MNDKERGEMRWSVLDIKCRHHKAQDDPFLMRLRTADGRTHVSERGELLREEWVGDFDTKAVAPTPPGDDQHFRLRLICDRPSCSYNLEMRSRKELPALAAHLYELWHLEIPYRSIDFEGWRSRQN